MDYIDAVNHQLANDWRPRHIISFSGGVPSAVMTYLVLKEHPDALVVFADVKIEDDDNYRFIRDVEKLIGHHIKYICVGVDPYEQAELEGYAWIPNQMTATCTRKLKIEPIMSLCREGDTIYIGFTHEDKSKGRDLNAPIENYRKLGVTVRYPLIEQNILTPADFIKKHGVDIPRMYRMGYKHGNCGGCCVKQGQGDWIRTLINFPERYALREAWEQKQRHKQVTRILAEMVLCASINPIYLMTFKFSKMYTLVRKVVDGVNVGVTLEELRLQHEQENRQPNFFDVVDELNGGSCSVECGVGSPDELAIAIENIA